MKRVLQRFGVLECAVLAAALLWIMAPALTAQESRSPTSDGLLRADLRCCEAGQDRQAQRSAQVVHRPHGRAAGRAPRGAQSR